MNVFEQQRSNYVITIYCEKDIKIDSFHVTVRSLRTHRMCVSHSFEDEHGAEAISEGLLEYIAGRYLS